MRTDKTVQVAILMLSCLTICIQIVWCNLLSDACTHSCTLTKTDCKTNQGCIHEEWSYQEEISFSKGTEHSAQRQNTEPIHRELLGFQEEGKNWMHLGGKAASGITWDAKEHGFAPWLFKTTTTSHLHADWCWLYCTWHLLYCKHLLTCALQIQQFSRRASH